MVWKSAIWFGADPVAVSFTLLILLKAITWLVKQNDCATFELSWKRDEGNCFYKEHFFKFCAQI